MSAFAEPYGSAEVSADAICATFNALFSRSERTLLQGGAAEPLYLPAHDSAFARILFRHDYPSSALHEVAHWCIAGRARRALVDYGYWYAPDGRSPQQQRQFVQVEARPQALEWLFSRACALPFRISVDNLEAPPDAAAEDALRDAVVREARRCVDAGMPPRAALFLEALRANFHPGLTLSARDFSAAVLR